MGIDKFLGRIIPNFKKNLVSDNLFNVLNLSNCSDAEFIEYIKNMSYSQKKEVFGLGGGEKLCKKLRKKYVETITNYLLRCSDDDFEKFVNTMSEDEKRVYFRNEKYCPQEVTLRYIIMIT